MRDPERIPRMCKKLEELWKTYPDLRMGQLIESVKSFGKMNSLHTFNIEDDLMEELIDNRLKYGWK